MTINIGIDLDSTLVDSFAVWQRYFNRPNCPHGHHEMCRAVPPTWEYYPELCKDCFKEVLLSPEALESSALYPHAKEAIYRLCAYHGARLYLVSHREPALSCSARILLDNHGIGKYFSGITLGWEPKSVTCGARAYKCDILIDDNPAVINEVADSGERINTICFAQPYNDHVRVPRVNSWLGALRIVQDFYGHIK